MLSVAARSQAGGPKKANQDRFYINKEKAIFAVLDGHGSQGGLFAEAVVESFDQTTCKADLFMIAAHGLLSKPHLYDGGTTATVLTLNEEAGLIVVSAVGDSDARVWLPRGSVSEPAEKNGYPLNADHSATSESERKRIMEEATVKGLRFLYDGYASVGPAKDIYSRDLESGEYIKDPKGVYHTTVRGEWASYVKCPSGEQLAVTRAFGDFGMQPYGVSSLATTEIWPYDCPSAESKGTLSVIIASDGFWDTVQFEAVGEIVRRPEFLDTADADAAVAALMEYGMAEGTRNFGSSRDDMTVMVLYFKA